MCSLLCSCGDASNSNGITSNVASQSEENRTSDLKDNTNDIAASNSKYDCRYITTLYNAYDTGCILGWDTAKEYADYETTESVVLCSKSNCTHLYSDCIANIIGDTPVIYNDYIYYFVPSYGVNEIPDGREFYMKTTFNRLSLATSEIEKITEFTDCIPREYDGCLIVNDTLYFCADNMNPTFNDYGDIKYANVGGTHFLCSINFNTGEYTNYGSIYDDDKQYESAGMSSTAKIMGFYDSKIYIEYSFMKEDFEFSEKTADVDARDVFTVLNFEFDLSTNEIKESDLPPAAFMDNDTYVYSNYPELSSTVIDNGNKYTIEGIDVGANVRFFNGKIFMYDYWYDINDQSKHSLGEYTGWDVLAIYNDCYILENGGRNKIVKLTEEELLALNEGN